MIYGMASKVSVLVTDDLDGSPDANTSSFGIDGVLYEIDLAAKNQAKLSKVLAPYIAAGRRVRPRRSPSRTGFSASTRADNSAVRTWATENGLAVSTGGRISADVLKQYEAAH
jgi:hypothetical protein